MPRQSGRKTCESKSGSSTTTGVGPTPHSAEKRLLTASRSSLTSHLSHSRWKVRTTSGKSECGTANGESTKFSANIIGVRRNPCRLRRPSVPTNPGNELPKSETMPANRPRDRFHQVHEFVTLYDLREKNDGLQHDDNHHRPHGSLDHLSPSEFVPKGSVKPKEAAPLQC